MLDTSNEGALAALVADLERALVAQDAQGVADLFLETGFWRDLAAFTWNLKTCEGRAEIGAMAAAQLSQVAPQMLHLDPSEAISDAGGVTEGWL
ncbi:MAG: NAD(P)/FAD-dependent oxidoreductase, partial [Gemmobacter sp.]